jgi:hypothetical protein
VEARDDDVGLRRTGELDKLGEGGRTTDHDHVLLAGQGSLDHLADEAGEVDEEDADLLNSDSSPPGESAVNADAAEWTGGSDFDLVEIQSGPRERATRI